MAQTKDSATRYNVDTHVYPEDLLSENNNYGGHRVVFYINIQEASKLSDTNQAYTKKEAADLNIQLASGSDLQSLAEKNPNATKLLQGVSLTAGGAVLKKVAGVSKLSKGATVAANAGVIASTTLANIKYGRRRLKTAITLHMPQAVSSSFRMQYDADTTKLVGGVLSAYENSPEMKKALTEAGQASIGSLVGDVIKTLELQAPFGAGFQRAYGITPNPRKEQVFQGVNFRTFSFDYQFFPRSASEAESVMRIINLFKLHMHPEYTSEAKFNFVYPSEFEIHYFMGNKENKNLEKVMSCILTDMTINYSPQGVFNTFENGIPSQINVQMQFTELGIMTKESFEAFTSAVASSDKNKTTQTYNDEVGNLTQTGPIVP